MTGPVTRLQVVGNTLSVPRHVASENDQPLAHVLFALKHEGTNLQILAEALPQISAREMLSELVKAPNGAYIRLACFLWEQFANRELELLAPVGGNDHLVFDPERYVTGPTVRHAKWRVAFNGLGTMQYCATVQRTSAIDAQSSPTFWTALKNSLIPSAGK